MPHNSETTPYIQIRNLYKVFGKNPQKVMPKVLSGTSKDDLLAETGHALGLRDINLDIQKGETFVIMGLSGSGKSTLIRHFNRLIDPTEGQILIEGEDILTLSEKQLEYFRRQKMSMVFQRFGLLPHRSVLDNIGYGLKIQGIPKQQILDRATHWLEVVGLKGYEAQYPGQLSGGQQQRVGLARALATDADILLMDEAFSALDPLIRSEMQDQLVSLQEKLHKTIIFITHDLDEALHLGDRIAILKDGELVQVGTPRDILLTPATDYVEAFVKDVNRARALTVETVMKPPATRLTALTIGEALDQMRASPKDYAFVEDESGYQGVILQKTLEKAARKNAEKQLDDKVYTSVPEISPEALLEEVLPDSLDTQYPLPVVCEEGKLQGELSRETVAEVLGDHKESDETSNAA